MSSVKASASLGRPPITPDLAPSRDVSNGSSTDLKARNPISVWTQSRHACERQLCALTEFDAMAAELQPLIDKVWRHCEDKGSRRRTVMLQVKFNDFEIITRSRSVPVAVSSRSNLELPVNCPAPERDAAFQTGVPLGNLARYSQSAD